MSLCQVFVKRRFALDSAGSPPETLFIEVFRPSHSAAGYERVSGLFIYYTGFQELSDVELLVPASAMKFFRQGRHSDAFHAWRQAPMRAGKKKNIASIARQVGVSSTSIFAKLKGEYSWSRAELLKAYQHLSELCEASGDDIGEYRRVHFSALLQMPGHILRGDKVQFVAAAPVAEEPLGGHLTVGVLHRPPFAEIDREQIGGVFGGLLDCMRRLLYPYRTPATTPIDAETLGSISVSAQLMKVDVLLPITSALHRRREISFVEAPGLRLPLNGVARSSTLLEFLEEYGGTSWCGQSVRALSYVTGQKEQIFHRAKFITVHGSAGDAYLRGILKTHERISTVHDYSVEDVGAAFLEIERSLHTHSDGVPLVVFVGDDTRAIEVARYLGKKAPPVGQPHMAALGVPIRGHRLWRGSTGATLEDELNLPFPKYRVGFGIHKKREDFVSELRDATLLVLEQEPFTLLDLYKKAFHRQEFASHWWRLIDYMEFHQAIERVHGERMAELFRHEYPSDLPGGSTVSLKRMD